MQADVKTWIAASHLVHDYWDFISHFSDKHQKIH